MGNPPIPRHRAQRLMPFARAPSVTASQFWRDHLWKCQRRWCGKSWYKYLNLCVSNLSAQPNREKVKHRCGADFPVPQVLPRFHRSVACVLHAPNSGTAGNLPAVHLQSAKQCLPCQISDCQLDLHKNFMLNSVFGPYVPKKSIHQNKKNKLTCPQFLPSSCPVVRETIQPIIYHLIWNYYIYIRIYC